MTDPLPGAASPVVTVRRNRLTGWLADLNIGTKVLVAVGLVAVMAGAIGVTALSRMSTMNDGAKAMQTANANLSRLSEVRARMTDMYNYSIGAAITEDPAGRAALVEGVKKYTGQVTDAFEAYKAGFVDIPQAHAELAAFEKTWQEFQVLRDIVMFGAPLPGGTDMVTTAEQLGKASTEINIIMDGMAKNEREVADGMAAEASDQYDAARISVIVLLVGGLLLAVAAARVVTRMIVSRMRALSRTLAAMARGDLTQTAEVTSRDEVGHMAVAVNQANDAIRQAIGSMAASADTLAAGSGELTAVSDRIAASAEEASAQAGNAAAAAGQVSQNVQTVSAGSEEMGSSIREIAHNAGEGAKVASRAVEVAASTNETVAQLGASSAEIGSVIKTITSIAEQTNLLALNATIEAARAGDAGKGFAVVAGEVKDLAQETAKATEDISKRVEAIQADTESAVAAIAEISEIIGKINDYQLTITSAVEEQTATTNEMNRSVAEAAQGSTDIAANIAVLADAARVTAEGVTESRRAAADMAELSSRLHGLVSRFRY
ncbi:methyl-accepting chemotaxis protein [Planomonospora corallina]|uniref:Methyl-accepting chemotaxis protein n=1 Tax=Planomonospora corallina TaxID=1806052 RepID=A0ABV8ICZ8_9ACTN